MPTLHGVYLHAKPGKKYTVNRSISFVLLMAKERRNIQRQLGRSNKILTVYQLNILNNVMHMPKIKKSTAPNAFLLKFQKPSYFYPTFFSIFNSVNLTY